MATIVIDGVTYEVNPDNNLLQECLSQGLNLPYFCWHPCMGSVGACRQCAVKQYRDKDDTTGMVVMACMTPAADGSIISIEDEQVKKFRANVIESLMISHPHDCPVCEEGGECHLQDMTLMSGHNYRRYDRKKVTHRNQYLGPFIGHEMNRCITCYRCVRYYSDYAGGTDLSAQASHHHTYFGRQSDGCLESEFSGNLVEVCPTGVFTDATFSQHYSRKWDLQCAPSVCVGCSVGCNTTPGERYGSLRRIVNRYHGEINGYFLCDRGRFGYEFVNSDKRITQSLGRSDEQSQVLGIEEARQRLAGLLGSADDKTLGIGSPRASNEANFALLQLVGEDNFYAGCSDTDFELLQSVIALHKDPRFHSPSVREIEEADAILIVGEDVTNVAPRIALALRQSVRNRADELAASARIPAWQDAAVRELAQDEKSPLYILSGYASRLDDIACGQAIDGVNNLAGIAAAVANRISDNAPAVDVSLDDGELKLVADIVTDLLKAKRPLVIGGCSNGSVALLNAAANIARALAETRQADRPVDFCCLVPEVNSIGLGLMAGENNSLGVALSKMQSGEVANVVVLENDLYRRASEEKINKACAAIKQLIVIDQLQSETTDKADLLLASTSFAEQESSYVNYEGRAQLSMQVYISKDERLPAWQWLDVSNTSSFEATARACESSQLAFAGLSDVLPDKSHYIGGMKVPRQSHRYSGRTAMNAGVNVHESKQPQDKESVMAFSMEGMSSLKDSSVMASAWAPQWNSNQSISKFQDEIAGEMKQGNPGKKLIEKNGEAGGYASVSLEKTSPDGFCVIPAFQIFGSDELSVHGEAIQERLTGSYVAISPADAVSLQVDVNDSLAIDIDGSGTDFPVCIREKVKPGTVVVFNGSGRFLDLGAGRSVGVSKSSASVVGRFDNLICSDLQEGGA